MSDLMLLYDLKVKGLEKTWGFQIIAKPEHANQWKADGLDVDPAVWGMEWEDE